MREVRVAVTTEGTVPEVERCWYDTQRWVRWVDGLADVLAVDGPWPQAGATVTWESGPAGRGHVTEAVFAHEPLHGQTLEVSDDSMQGRQTVTFTPVELGVEVQLSLLYELRRRSILSPLLDLLFIRRAMTDSLQSTVHRFTAELQASRARARTPR